MLAVSSEVDTSAIESVGVPSSSVIVTVPVASEIAELVGLLKPIVKVSSNSSITSWTIVTEIVLDVSPGLKCQCTGFDT